MKLYTYNGQPTNYSITEDGKVFSHTSNKFLKGSVNKNGYVVYTLRLPNRQVKKKLAHRLVMETFSPNLKSKELEVNHKNGIKTDNRLENLEWVTRQENLQHAFENDLCGLSKKIYAFNEDKELVAFWRSLAYLYRDTGFQTGNISRNCLEKERIKINGYYWSFSEEPDFEIKKIESGKAKPIGRYDLNGNLIETYPSRAAAARALNCNPYHISEVCNGKLKSYKGYWWKYLI